MMDRLSKARFTLLAFQSRTDPQYANDIYSLPNKFYDSLTAGTPVIIGKRFVSMKKIVEETQTGIILNLLEGSKEPSLIQNALESYDCYLDNLTYLLKIKGLPLADTFISNDFDEIEAMKENLTYPLVSKRFHGASSREVTLIRNPRELSAYSRRIFSFYGIKASNAYFRQKNYLYLQEFVDGDGLDIRVNVAEDVITGYFRKPRRNDFRASGSGVIIKEDLPLEAVEIALKTYDLIGKPMLGVDMMRDREGKYWIIEISPFIGVITPIQMKVDDIPGSYFLLEDGTLQFTKETYWPQELAMKNFFERNYLLPEAEWKSNLVRSVVSEKKLKKGCSV